MLIDSYELETDVSTHSAEHVEYDVIAHLQADISDVFPYLNATLTRGIYMPARPAFSWRYGGRNIGFWPRRIAVDHLHSHEEIASVVEELVDLVNDVWARRHEIEPDETIHERRQPLELYRLLPRTNCKACGENSCYTFALRLAGGQVEAPDCSPLYSEPKYVEQRGQIELILSTKWPML
jgi:ArsR family metal-binding transcriptional regulator